MIFFRNQGLPKASVHPKWRVSGSQGAGQEGRLNLPSSRCQCNTRVASPRQRRGHETGFQNSPPALVSNRCAIPIQGFCRGSGSTCWILGRTFWQHAKIHGFLACPGGWPPRLRILQIASQLNCLIALDKHPAQLLSSIPANRCYIWHMFGHSESGIPCGSLSDIDSGKHLKYILTLYLTLYLTYIRTFQIWHSIWHILTFILGRKEGRKEGSRMYWKIM